MDAYFMKPRSSPPHSAPRTLRIIAGSHRRSLLSVVDAKGLRPTPDRVRETLFNWLGQDLSGWRCWDAFAGSGALGFEAASRGAAEVVLVEQAPEVVRSLTTTLKRLNMPSVRVLAADAVDALRQARGQAWDLVFLDPPFDQPELLLGALSAAHEATAAQGLCYVESGRLWPAETWHEAGWQAHKAARAASVHYCLLTKREPSP